MKKVVSLPPHLKAQMAELVDAYVSGAYIERCAGSIPVLGTKKKNCNFAVLFFVLESLGLESHLGTSFEFSNFLSRNLDGFLGARIAAFSGSTLNN